MQNNKQIRILELKAEILDLSQQGIIACDEKDAKKALAIAKKIQPLAHELSQYWIDMSNRTDAAIVLGEALADRDSI